VQQRQAGEVDGQAHRGDDEHHAGVDLGRVPDPADRLHDDVAGDGDQQQPVGDGAEDLRALPAEGAPSAGGALGQRDRPERQTEAQGVGGHVPGVGEQGQRPGDHRAGDLRGDHRDGEAEDDGQPAAVRGRGGSRRGAVVVPVPHHRSPAVAFRTLRVSRSGRADRPAQIGTPRSRR
jgi:hypothetical protein